jgi:hypothetical protein
VEYTIIQFTNLQGFSLDPLTDILRSGPRWFIEQAVEAGLVVPLESYASDNTDDCRARLVRCGHLPRLE